MPYLIEQEFIDDPEDSEFSDGVDLEQINLTDAALPEEYAHLLSEVGGGSVLFPTEEGPARFGILSPKESAEFQGTAKLFLEKSEQEIPDQLTPFLVDDAGSLVAYLNSENQVCVVTMDGDFTGPVESLLLFFSKMFENAQNHELPFEGM